MDQTSRQPDIIDAFVIDIENLHHIQRNILAQLYTVPSAAYADLKPAELTGNSFNYHLRHVIAQKLIMQSDDGRYRLSSTGRLLLDNVSLPSMKLKLRPVVGLLLLIRSPEHGYLLYESNREPIRGQIGLPFGKLRLGDSLENTLGRMLQKRGLIVDAVSESRSLGLANIRYYHSGQLVAHRCVSVWRLTYQGAAEVTRTSHGHSLWIQNSPEASRILPEVAAVINWPLGQSSLEITADLPG